MAGYAATGCRASKESRRGAGTIPARVVTPVPRFDVEPTVRVGVAWGDTLIRVSGDVRWWIHEVGSSRPVAVVDETGYWEIVRYPFETALRVVRPDGYVSQPHVEPVSVAPLGPGLVRVNGTAYPGSVEVSLRPDGTLTAVNVVAMETYLEGVVAKEMGRPGIELFEALKAQAVAARTYALRRMGSRSALGFDLFGSVEDQAYGGRAARGDSLAVRAVRATRGEAILYDGRLIEAFYHSTCGGQTASVEDVFDLSPMPYLQTVSDAMPGGDGYWCQESRYFRWNVEFDRDELTATVLRNLPLLAPLPPDGIGRVIDVELIRSTPEGRAMSVQVVTSTGQYSVGENDIRSLFADADGRLLRSTLFLFRPEREDGRVSNLRITGGGWGHGVGMCQVGAMGRSRAGHGYREILAAYYTGTTVSALY